MQKRLLRRAEEKKAEMLANGGSMSVRESRTGQQDRTGGGSLTPKASWLRGRLTSRRPAYGASDGLLSSRSALQSTARSMLSTSRTMMTTARSDVATGRYNDGAPEITETRILEMRELADSLADQERRRGTAPRAGKTPRKSASTAAGLRTGLLRRGVLQSGRNRATGRTPRTSRMSAHAMQPRMPGERPTHGG